MENETIKTEQHGPQASEKSPSLEGTPGGKTGTTSQGTAPKDTYTRAEHEKEIKTLRDSAAELGRKVKTLTDEATAKANALTEATTKVKELSDSVGKLQDRLDELENEGLKNTPEGVKALQALNEAKTLKRKAQQELDAAAKERAENAEDIKLAKEAKFERQVIGIAYEFKADAAKLAELCREFNLTTDEQIRKQAKVIAGSADSGQAEDTGSSETHIDSAKGKGGGEKTDEEKLQERYPSMAQKK